jgi:mersacidin/lichenicidin family type 2 lantibiotic
MSPEAIIRAWKDASFRAGLSDTERALLPEHPSGLIELDDAQLETAAGARPPYTENNTCTLDSYVCCCDSVVGCF